MLIAVQVRRMFIAFCYNFIVNPNILLYFVNVNPVLCTSRCVTSFRQFYLTAVMGESRITYSAVKKTEKGACTGGRIGRFRPDLWLFRPITKYKCTNYR